MEGSVFLGWAIAQTVNVLQAMILTDGEKMVLTPTYHVFEMYAVQQDATPLPAELTCPEYTHGNEVIPLISASSSKAADGTIHVSLCNLHATQGIDVWVELMGTTAKTNRGRILTADAVPPAGRNERRDARPPNACHADPMDKLVLSATVAGMRFSCQLTESNGVWTGLYAGTDIGPVRVTAPTRADAVRKLEGEIRYRLEICACTGESYRDIQIEVLPVDS
jgi:alpha-L-arabinofuranosidase